MTSPYLTRPLRSEADFRAIGTPASSYIYKLVDETTGEEVTLPTTRKCWDGAELTINEFKPSRFKDNPGYIITALNETFCPSVCGLKIAVIG